MILARLKQLTVWGLAQRQPTDGNLRGTGGGHSLSQHKSLVSWGGRLSEKGIDHQ